MQTREGKIIDRREMLRVKLKTLSAEARIIRREELKSRGELRQSLYLHRVYTVRLAARETHLAYGLIRGRTLEQMEPVRYTEPDWSEVARMVKKYGALAYRDIEIDGGKEKLLAACQIAASSAIVQAIAA